MAYIDSLTGIKNRMSYAEKIKEFKRKPSNDDVVYTIMLDIDNFKKINDNFGHYAGDLILKAGAEKINHIFNEENYSFFRIGGDEFAIIAENVPIKTLKEKINRLKLPILADNITAYFSIGYSTVDFNQTNAMENAFIRADTEMYENKLKSKVFNKETYSQNTSSNSED